MVKNFDKSLFNLRNTSVYVSPTNYYPEPGKASVELLFGNGSKLRAEYWRVTREGKVSISSFDHQQQYGLPAPIDAIKELQENLRDRTVTHAQLDGESGDLFLAFSGNIKFRVFNFTSYEVWEIHFPDGTGEYSPYAK